MNSDTQIEDVIRAMASEYLNEQGVHDVNQHLKEGNIKSAQAYLCGALDRAAAEEYIDTETYKAERERLGLSQAEINKMRQMQ